MTRLNSKIWFRILHWLTALKLILKTLCEDSVWLLDDCWKTTSSIRSSKRCFNPWNLPCTKNVQPHTHTHTHTHTHFNGFIPKVSHLKLINVNVWWSYLEKHISLMEAFCLNLTYHNVNGPGIDSRHNN